jgi:hypothetical protein
MNFLLGREYADLMLSNVGNENYTLFQKGIMIKRNKGHQALREYVENLDPDLLVLLQYQIEAYNESKLAVS